MHYRGKVDHLAELMLDVEYNHIWPTRRLSGKLEGLSCWRAVWTLLL